MVLIANGGMRTPSGALAHFLPYPPKQLSITHSDYLKPSNKTSLNQFLPYPQTELSFARSDYLRPPVSPTRFTQVQPHSYLSLRTESTDDGRCGTSTRSQTKLARLPVSPTKSPQVVPRSYLSLRTESTDDDKYVTPLSPNKLSPVQPRSSLSLRVDSSVDNGIHHNLPVSPLKLAPVQPRSSLSLRTESTDDGRCRTLRPKITHQSYSTSVHTLRRQPRVRTPPSPPCDCLPTDPIPPPELFDF